MVTQTKKVAIVGGASSYKDAPFDNHDVDIWVLGNQMQRYKISQVDKIFEIHENLKEHDKQYPHWLVGFKIPLIVSAKFPIKADHISVFDYKKASNLIGENFSSSPAVMMAQAIMDGYTDISIYGIDMALDEHEYYMQRPAMEQWIGYAKGLGINVKIHPNSSLGHTTYREGRDWPNKGFAGFDDGFYNEMRQKHEQHILEIEKEINALEAAKQRYDQLIAKYQGHDGARQVYARLAKLERARKSGLNVDAKAING